MNKSFKLRTNILSRLLQPIVDWWNKDAIRISPREGRLLRLRPPCILRIDECEMMIGERKVRDHADGAQVTYVGHVTTDGRRFELRIVVGETHATWFIDDSVFGIKLSEVVVFEPTDRYRELTKSGSPTKFVDPYAPR